MKKRLNFSKRIIIQYEIEENPKSTLKTVSNKLAVSPSTIYREIMLNRSFIRCKLETFMHSGAKDCEYLNQYPFCCNVCPKLEKCSKKIYCYDAADAESKAKTEVHARNKGTLLTKNELKEIDVIISPMIIAKYSIYDILQKHPEIKLCESTIRTYIYNGYLSCKAIDLPRTVQRIKYSNNYDNKRRKTNPRLLANRTFSDYQNYIEKHENAVVLQLDSVIGKKSDKHTILTIFEPKSRYQRGFISSRDPKRVNQIISNFINKLITANMKFFKVILTDNGLEFSALPALQVNENGEFLFNLFYCDPYCSGQKGGCERNHEFIRYYIKKGRTLDNLTQNELDQVFSQINSIKRKSLNGLSPKEAFEKLFGNEILKLL